MATWKIPDEYVIQNTRNGDVVATFAAKVKWCLEELFDSVDELHLTTVDINSSLTSLSSVIAEGGNSSNLGGIGVEIASISDGQILVYRESDNKFHNEDNINAGGGSSIVAQQDVGHLTRLVENLYLTLDVARLNPGGYDGLSGETFYGNTNDIDTTAPHVTSLIQGDDTLALDSAVGLVEGSIYLLTDGTYSEWVKIKQIRAGNRGAQVVLQNPVSKQFDINSTRLRRSRGTISEGSIASRTGSHSTRGSFFTTNLIPFINEVTGEERLIKRAHLVVKHQNVADAEITAEIALRETATFVNGEIIGIGDGTEQTVRLANRTNLSSYKFALYFNGEKQTQDFLFDATTGEVTFTAPLDSIVSADYFYNWSDETFAEMEKTGTYPDRRNPNRVTTEFTYLTDTAGKIATLRLTLKRGTGASVVTANGTGKAQGFKLEHQTELANITVTPSTATAVYNAEQNTVIVTASTGDAITINYDWQGKSFTVDSFVCMFDE